MLAPFYAKTVGSLFLFYCIFLCNKNPLTLYLYSARCESCGYPVCNSACATGPNHVAECAVLTPVKDKIHVEDLMARGVLYWPISALRVLLLSTSSPKSWAIVQRMLSHRWDPQLVLWKCSLIALVWFGKNFSFFSEKQREKETWKSYEVHLVDFIRKVRES